MERRQNKRRNIVSWLLFSKVAKKFLHDGQIALSIFNAGSSGSTFKGRNELITSESLFFRLGMNHQILAIVASQKQNWNGSL